MFVRLRLLNGAAPAHRMRLCVTEHGQSESMYDTERHHVHKFPSTILRGVLEKGCRLSSVDGAWHC